MEMSEKGAKKGWGDYDCSYRPSSVLGAWISRSRLVWLEESESEQGNAVVESDSLLNWQFDLR